MLMDYALEWVHVQAGNPLYIQGELASGIYIVLNGRFRSIKSEKKPKKSRANSTASSGPGSPSSSINSHTPHGNNNEDEVQAIVGEHGQGESLGEIEVLTKSRRLTTVVAIRDSELARIPRTLFEMIALSSPSIMVNVSRIVAQRR
ncbi:unnamed protein product [Ambrosiozyma monospora]|uniref:Unnamed protein product n=1 Tax=Ambrosiozyma monospora TaxID=43982 RepID=A0ACB5UDP2_AMBMO|nr:unnamed protein product [Ambrosiozyma monospora]